MKEIYKIAIFFLAGLHLIRTVIKTDLTVAIFIVAVIVLVSGLSIMGQGFKKITLAFLVLGILILVKFMLPLATWMTSVNSMTNIIAILVILQTFTIPIEAGQYHLVLRSWLNKSFKGEGGLFLFTTLATHIFTSFLMFGAIPIMFSLMEEPLKTRVPHYERFIATAASRGYALASLWAPGAVNLFLVAQATGIGWSTLFFPGVVLGFAGIILSSILESKVTFHALRGSNHEINNHEIYHNEKHPFHDDSPNDSQVRRKLWHVLFVLISLIALTFLLGKLEMGSSANTVTLAGTIVVLLWILQYRTAPKLKPALYRYWDKGVLKAGDIAPFFIAVGIFTSALQQSGATQLIEIYLQHYAHSLGVWAIVLIPLTMISLSIVGIHPFVSIVMFGQILMALNLSLPPVTVALCLALGGSISYMLSPFAGVIMAIAKFINGKAEEIALHWNWIFCISYFLLGVVIAYYWGKIFG